MQNVFKNITFFAILFLVASSFGFAQTFNFTPNLQYAYSEITKLKITNAQQILAKESSNNGIKIMLDDYIDMISLLVSENESSFLKLEKNENERLLLLENFDKKSHYYLFVRAEIKLHWALVKMKFGHDIKASWNMIRAYKLLEENQKMFPNFLPNNTYLGVLHILIGSVPENYLWAAKIMGLHGSIQQGLHELQSAEKDKIFGNEAQFYALFIQAFILTFTEQKNQELKGFLAQNPDNLAISFLGVAIAMKDNRAEEAATFLQKRQTSTAYLAMPIFNLYQGDIFLQKKQYPQTLESYDAYLKGFQGKSFLKECYFKSFLAYWLSGDEPNAKRYLNSISKVGNTVAEADKSAQKFYDNQLIIKSLPNKFLMKSRLAFDGGYYQEAWNDLVKVTENSLSSSKEQAELNYRKGRILQKLNDLGNAIPFYERAISLSDKQDWHFGASSCLQIGYIFQAKNEKILAKKYFEKALSYKKHEYKNSVDNKARAALTALGD